MQVFPSCNRNAQKTQLNSTASVHGSNKRLSSSKSFLAYTQPAKQLLTARERSVLQSVAAGHSNKQIANLLSISVKTVETHRASVRRKLDLGSTADMVRYAIRNKLTDA